jgi:hypothetical protein
LPGRKSSLERPDLGESVMLQRERQTGTRVFIRSGAVGNDLSLAGQAVHCRSQRHVV